MPPFVSRYIFVHENVKVKDKMTDTKENTSWSNNVIINMLDSVPNYEECQNLCQVQIVILIEAFDPSLNKINLFSRMSQNALLGLGQATSIQILRFHPFVITRFSC